MPAGGLTEAEAARRLALAGRPARQTTSRSYASIVRANVLTVFNLILAGFGVVTLIFGDARDALFLGIIVANSTIGISQEVRAKRALDRLSLLVAPHANVRRDGAVRTVEVEQVVVDDVVMLAPGDQVIADGTVLTAADLRLDESILTGESEPARRGVGEEVRSGAFVVEGTGAYRVTAVGEDSFAARITGEARSFRHPRSPLERAVNRLLYALVALVVVLGAVLGYSLYHRHVTVHTAVANVRGGGRDDDPGGSDGAGQPHLRRRRRAHVAPRRARAAAQRDRVAGLGRHDLRRQDRHADRSDAPRRRARTRGRGRRGDASARRWRRSPRARRRAI